MVQLILVLIGALLVTALARSREIAAPLLLVAVGRAVSLVPGLDELNIAPELLLAVVLPPLLHVAALESSFTNSRARSRPIAPPHCVLQVIAMSFVLGWIGSRTCRWPRRSCYGAVIAPPDAVTAAAIGRRLKLPRGVMTVLGGESLINDAAALTIYRIAVTAAVGTTPALGEGPGVFALAVAVGVVLGPAFGMLAQPARQHIPEVQVRDAAGRARPVHRLPDGRGAQRIGSARGGHRRAVRRPRPATSAPPGGWRSTPCGPRSTCCWRAWCSPTSACS